MNINTLLLDLDGTLINTEKPFYQSFYQVLMDNYNIIINEELYKKCELDKNATLLDTLRTTNDNIKNISNEDIMKQVYKCYTEKFISAISEEDARQNFELLSELRKEGYRLALVTTCSKKYLDILIKYLNISDLFECIISREDSQYLKPNPEAYEMAIKKLNASKNECLAIEDSKRGIDAAIGAGVNVVKVEEYTSVKFDENRCESFYSVKDVLNKLIKEKLIKY